MEIPVYLLTGFLESGKTAFIKDTLQDPEFHKGEKTLLIVCEEGEEEYSQELLHSCNTNMVVVEEAVDFQTSFLKECQKKYAPTQVVIEYNGMWAMNDILLLHLPKGWNIVQMITLVNAQTFETYINNMRSILAEQFKNTDMVIFNRCDETTSQSFCKRNIKAVSRRAQVYFEMADGSQPPYEEEELPFDLEAPVIEISDDDFGLWYLDALDHVEKYKGKTVKFRGMVYRTSRFPADIFVPGRFAMTCCADDTAFIGFMCHSPGTASLKSRQWVMVTARVDLEYQKEYQGEGPVLYAQSVALTGEPEEKLVYFN